MKAPAILVPFKGAEYKSRLSSILNTSQRRQLAFLLLRSTLGTIRRARLKRHCYVVSSDRGAEEAAKKAGASYVRESRANGVNSAVRLAVKKLPRRDRFMVVPCDLAMLSVSDLGCALRAGEDFPFVISPSSSFDGTNLLIFPRRMVSSLSYDNNSFWNHLAAAARHRLRTAVVTKRGIVFDLDTPSEANELAASSSSSPTARFLRRSATT